MFGFFVSDGVKEMCKSMIENPHDWVQGHYEFQHKKHHDLAIWTCNGIPYIRIGNNKGLSLDEKKLINRSIKKSIANRLSSPQPSKSTE